MGVRYEIQFNLENSITEPSRVLFVSHRAMLQIKMDDFCGAFHGVTNTFGYVFRQLLLDTADGVEQEKRWESNLCVTTGFLTPTKRSKNCGIYFYRFSTSPVPTTSLNHNELVSETL